jgi:hypothetical protein
MIFGLEYFPFFISGCLVIRDLFNIKSANFHSAESLQSSIWGEQFSNKSSPQQVCFIDP